MNCSKHRKKKERAHREKLWKNGWFNMALGDRAYHSVELDTLMWQLLDSISDQCSSGSDENKGQKVCTQISSASEAFGTERQCTS